MFDFLKPKILEEVDSRYSGRIKVVKNMGDIYIATGPLTQSGGLVSEVWQAVISKLRFSPKSCLILGLAGGTIAGQIAKKFPGIKITGVEIDPVMVDLGKKYLSMDKIPDLEIIVADAKVYVFNSKSHFDLILVDMYLGDKLPEFVYSPKFLNKLKLLSSYVIFNHLFYTPEKKQLAENLVNGLKKLFSRVELSRKLTNLLIVCQT